MLTVHATSLDDTAAVAAAVASVARAGDVIVLSGEMGAGKTAFAQRFGAAMGVTVPMTSPTFTLVHTYELGRVMLYHADLYRLDTHHEVADLGLLELVDDGGILLVEWGDPVAASFGDHLLVHLEGVDEDANARRITLTAVGRAWAGRGRTLSPAIAALVTGGPSPES